MAPPAVTLNYVGAIDVSSAYGCTKYAVSFPDTVVTNGSILMFEYKIQAQNVTNPTPSDLSMGFVNAENAVSMSASQTSWQISVPASDEVTERETAKLIQVRVYSGKYGSTEINVTDWSNSLTVYNPPPMPSIHTAYFDAPSTNADDLYVFISKGTYTANNKFVLAYYFKNSEGSTEWKVSEPLSGTELTIGGKATLLLSLREFGNVFSTSGDYSSSRVYVAVYAVYQFSHDENYYYSVSHISDPVTGAQVASSYSAPTIGTLTYNVYTGTQSMTVSWSAPANAVIPAATFSDPTYDLYVSSDGTNWDTVPDGTGLTSTSKEVNTSGYACNTTLTFKVRAVSSGGTISPFSGTVTQNIFKYSGAPNSLAVDSTRFDPDTDKVGVVVTFANPTDIGCGEGYRYVITATDGTSTYTQYQDYDETATSYTETFSALVIGRAGSVSVYLETSDTNGTGYRDGSEASVQYLATNFALGDVVYNDNVQTMVLTWTNPLEELTGWTVSSYSVHISTTLNGTTTQLSPVPTLNLTHTYNASGLVKGEQVSFYITASLTATDLSTHSLTSLTKTVSAFRYATAPTALVVNWASADNNLSYMDLMVTFEQPTSVGFGTPQHFVVIPKNTGGTELTNHTGGTPGRMEVPYNQSATSYNAHFNNLTYSYQGNVEVYLVTSDTNSESDKLGASQTSLTFTAIKKPIKILNTNTPSQIVFTVITQSLLVPNGNYVVGSTSYDFSTIDGEQAGVSVDFEQLPIGGEYKYIITLTPVAFGLGSFSYTGFSSVCVSNTVAPLTIFLS